MAAVREQPKAEPTNAVVAEVSAEPASCASLATLDRSVSSLREDMATLRAELLDLLGQLRTQVAAVRRLC